jgi:hypothetical protein
MATDSFPSHSPTVLWHVNPLLGNDSEISKYQPLLRNGSAKKCVSTATIEDSNKATVFCAVRAIILSRFWARDYRRGMDLFAHLYTSLETTSNYSATANLQNSRFNTVRAKPFSSLVCQQPFPSNGFQQWRFFSFPRSRRYCPANIPQLNSCRLSTQLQRHFFSASLAELG